MPRSPSFPAKRTAASIASEYPVIRPQRVALLVLPALPVFRTKICLNFRFACVSRPVGRGGLPEDILQIQSCPAFDEELNQFVIASPSGLMQRCRMGMAPHGVVSVWVFAGVKQQSNDFDAAKLRCQGECQVAIATVGGWK